MARFCHDVAEASGWCLRCAAELFPPRIAAAVTEPGDTGCGRR